MSSPFLFFWASCSTTTSSSKDHNNPSKSIQKLLLGGRSDRFQICPKTREMFQNVKRDTRDPGMSCNFYGSVHRDASFTNLQIQQILAATKANVCELIPAPPGTLSLLPTADGLVVTPASATQRIVVDGQSGINAYGLTSPSNTLTIRDLRNLTPFVVGPNPLDSEFQSVAAAVAAATAPGSSGGVVIIKDNPAGYVNETFTVPVGNVTFLGTSTSLSQLINPAIALTGTGSIVFDKVTLTGGSVTVSPSTVAVFSQAVMTGGIVIASTGSVQLFNSSAPLSTINLTGGSQHAIQNSRLQNLSISAPTSSVVISGSTFVNGANLTFTDLPAGQPLFIFYSNLALGTLTLTSPVSANSTLIIAASSLIGGTVAIGPQTGLFINSSGSQTTRYNPFPRFSTVQCEHVSFSLDRPLRFQGSATDFQTLKWCNLSNSSTGPTDFAPQNALISVESSAPTSYRAYLRTNHASIDAGASNPGGQTASVLNLDTGDVVLYSANMISFAGLYALDGGGAGGTVVRPSTTDNLGAFHGTNLIQGSNAVAAGVVVTDANPWTATIGSNTWNTA